MYNLKLVATGYFVKTTRKKQAKAQYTNVGKSIEIYL